MKRVIGFALLILFFVAGFASLVALMVSGGMELKVALVTVLGTLLAAILLVGVMNLIAWLLD